MAAFSRRKAMLGVAMSAIGIGTAAARANPSSSGITLADADSPDSALLALCEEFHEHQIDLEGWNDGEIEAEEGEAANEKWWAALRQIVDTPAKTLEGIQAKAEVLHHTVPMLTDAPEIDGELGLSLAADLMAMGAVA